MSRKDFIKSRINIRDDIKDDFSKCLESYLNNKKMQSNAPFHDPNLQNDRSKDLNKFKKTLTDWRSIYSQNKFKKTHRKMSSLFQGKQNTNRPTSNSLSFAKSTFSSNSLRKQHEHTPSQSCRKIHSSFSTSNQKQKSQLFDPTLTPFILIQNMYEASVNNFQHQKRAKTARIRQYYQKKAEKIESFEAFQRLQPKISDYSQQQILTQPKDFIRTGRLIYPKRRKQVPIYQKRSNRIIMPNEYFKDLNKVKIPRKYVFKEYPVEIKQ